jgi:hypothetical protein
MTQELKNAIADLQRAFRKSGLACLWIAFGGVRGTFIGTMDEDGRSATFDLPPDFADETNGKG